MFGGRLNSLKKSFIFQGGILAMSGIIVRIIGMFYRIPMVNIIGSEGAGLYSVAFNVYNIVLILSSYGMPMAVSKLVSARLVKNEYRNTKFILIRALVISAVSGGVAALLLLFGAGFIEHTLYSKYVGMAIPLRVLAPTVFIFAILGVFRGFFQGQGNMVPTAISQLVEQIVNAVVSIVASYAFIRAFAGSADAPAHGAAGGTLGTCLGALSALIVVAVIFFRNISLYRKKISSDVDSDDIGVGFTYKLIIITIIPIIIGQTFYNISAVIDDALFSGLSKLDSSASTIAIGNYGQSFSTLTSIPMGIASAMSASLLPSIVNSFTRKDTRGVNKKLAHTVRITMMVAIPFVIILTALGQPIIQVLFRAYDSEQGSIMLKIGASAIVFYTLSTVTSAALQGVDRMRTPVIHSAIALAVHIPVVAILLAATNLGIYSLVIGVMVFSAIVFSLNLRSLYKLTGYRQQFIRPFIIPLICAAIMGIVSLLLYTGLHAAFGHVLPALIISAFVALIVYFGLLTGARKTGWY